MRYQLALCVVTFTWITGCATQSSNMALGTDMSYASLKDQREAVKTVQELPEVPQGGRVLGTVDASRCHRNALQTAPMDAEVLIDLKVAAYAKGADGITGVKIVKDSGLIHNCWVILSGTATAFSF